MYCKCGCGGITTKLKYDDPIRGKLTGDYKDYIRGHWHEMRRRSDPEYGKKYRNFKKIESLRGVLVKAINDAKKTETLDDIQKQFKDHGLSMWSVTRILNYTRSNLQSLYGNVRVLPREHKKSKYYCRPYDRPDIPNERATDISLLTALRHFSSLDCAVLDDKSLHDVIPCHSKTPLEILMEQEEAEEIERQDRISQAATQIWNSKKGKPIYSYSTV